MDFMKLKATLSLDSSEYEKGLDGAKASADGLKGKLANGIGKTAKAVTKTLAVAGGAAATAVGVITKSSVAGYADMEQFKGGIETLFGDSAQKVLDDASDAFMTAGMSANKYMETSIQSASALIKSLDGGQAKAAELMNTAVIDMADNVNKMGTRMEDIQNAYRGFSRGNFTMLDNLALGFSGTKQGMEELLAEAEKISGIKYDISSYSDIVQAIHVVQDEMGIAGTTADEAKDTITGSLASVKTAWENLVVGFADPDADLGKLISNVVDTATTAFGNLMPAVEKALGGIATFVSQIAPTLASSLPSLVQSVLPQLLSAAGGLVTSVIGVAPQLIKTIATSAIEAIPQIIEQSKSVFASIDLGGVLNFVDKLIESIDANADTFISKGLELLANFSANLRSGAGTLVSAGLNIITHIAQGIAKAMPAIIQNVPTIVSNIAGIINDNAPKILAAGVNIIITLGKGIIQAIPVLIANLPKIIDAIWNVFTAVNWLALGGQLITGILNGIKALGKSIPSTLKSIASNAVKAFKSAGGWKTVGRAVMNVIVSGLKALVSLPSTILRKAASLAMKAFTSISWGTVGKNIVSGIARGITAGLSVIVNAAKNAAKSALNAAKNFLGIQSPSKVFRNQVGKNIALGMAKGIEDGEDAVNTALKSLNASALSTSVVASPSASPLGATSAVNGGDVFNFNMAYDAGNDANDLLRDFARGVQRYRMAGAI